MSVLEWEGECAGVPFSGRCTSNDEAVFGFVSGGGAVITCNNPLFAEQSSFVASVAVAGDSEGVWTIVDGTGWPEPNPGVAKVVVACAAPDGWTESPDIKLYPEHASGSYVVDVITEEACSGSFDLTFLRTDPYDFSASASGAWEIHAE